MEAKIRRLRDHFILCGYGRVGRAIADTLNQQSVEFVIIDRNEGSVKKAEKAGFLVILDDATSDNVLKHARIDRARGLITAFGSDADNTYTALAVRELNPTLPIIARASNEDAQRKLQQAGANRVVATATIGGQRMARLALRPEAVEFIEAALFSEEQQLLFEEIEIGDESLLAGSTIRQIEDRFPGVRILVLKRQDGTMFTNPAHTTTVEIGITITALGTQEQLKALEVACGTCKVCTSL